MQLQSNPDWPNGTLELANLYQLECDSDSRQYVEWAVDALVAGFDTPSLRMLAGLDLNGEPLRADVIPAFERSLKELKIDLPDPPTTARLYVLDVAARIVSGSVAPSDGVELIHSRVVSPLDHPHDLRPWCYLWAGNSSDGSCVLEGVDLDAEIVRVANESLRLSE